MDGFVAGGLRGRRWLKARPATARGVPLLNVAYRQLPKARITANSVALRCLRHIALTDEFIISDYIVMNSS